MKEPIDSFDAQLASEMVKRTDKLGVATVDMALQLKQAREFMAWSASHLRQLWTDWLDEADKSNHKMTLFRMAFDRESKSVIASGKDVKEFFSSPDYLVAHAKLAEMVALLEKFEALKKNGTMDAFADFILKVSCK